jgi:hypothetical protein
MISIFLLSDETAPRRKLGGSQNIIALRDLHRQRPSSRFERSADQTANATTIPFPLSMQNDYSISDRAAF